MKDVAIVGAGPVGATLALALADANLDLVVADARQPGSVLRADRTLALSHGARLILERLGVWPALAASDGAVTPIVTIDVSQAGGFGVVELTAAEQGVPALGYVVSYRALQAVLDRALARARVDVRFGASVRAVHGGRDVAQVEIAHDGDGAIDTRLAVVADGASSPVPGIARKRHEYRQMAVVASVGLDRPHRGVAYERFTPEGPIALLPERDHYALVWTRSPADAQQTLAMSEEAFLAALAARFGTRVKGFTGVHERRTFPLALEVARNTASERVVVIGNAAQALHPVAGQGFNLGLRDAYDLARTIVDTPREALGTKAMLDRYRRSREPDRQAGIVVTHGLVRLFSNDRPWLRVPRGAGMMLLDALPFAKRAFGRAMLFGVH
ncbi:MAG: FAD-dependent monooxygenase [Rudaea sp.]